MADDGSQQRKPDFRTPVEDVKALDTVLIIEAQSDYEEGLPNTSGHRYSGSYANCGEE